MRILLIEDEPTLREQLHQALQAGHTVETAADGETAQYLGEVESFDAAVLDLGLPVRDGLSVLRAWRAQGRSMPVLILTARAAWHEKVAGMDAGADDYLAKPFHMEELLARLRALLRRLSPCQRTVAMRLHHPGLAPGARHRRRSGADADQP
jgi:two-component system OmpR family response regulator